MSFGISSAMDTAPDTAASDSLETNLLSFLQSLRDSREAFAAGAKRIADRCAAEHADDPTRKAWHQHDVDHKSEKIGEDFVMKDADDATADPKKTIYCRPCYNDLIDLMRDSYAASTQAYWQGAQQTALLAELERFRNEARELRTPMTSAEEHIQAQTKEWLQEQLKNSVAVQMLAHQADASIPSLQSLLSDPTSQVVDLALAISDNAKSVVNGESEQVFADIETATKKLQQSIADPNTKIAIYREILFPNGVPDVPAVRAVEKKIADGTVGLDQGLGEMIRDVYGGEDEDARAAKIEKHTKRLAELKRAKAAHEAQKAKKMKPVDVPSFLQGDASCATCGKSSDPQKSPFCELCFLEFDYCLRDNQTVWCSCECMKKGYTSHMASSHPCNAGKNCARAKTDSDSTARQEPRYYFCRECVLSFSIGTVYCSERCAGRDFQNHREKVHLPNRQMRADTHDDANELSYADKDKAVYTAAKISKHVLPLEEALASVQKKHPDWNLTKTKVKMTLA